MPGEFTTDLAVVVGIDAYEPGVGRLQTPVRDAEAVARLLASRFGYEVILQCDGTATLAGLCTLLSDLSKRVQAGSRLLFYFAGHGVALDSAELEGPRGYLVPYGATPGVDTHLPMHALYEALATLPCRHLLVVLDCCFSGSFRWADRRPMYVPGELLYEERYQHWVRHPARWFLASAAHDEFALDTAGRRRGEEEKRHSPFASALVDGLTGEADTRPAGGDGIVTLAELYAYVQDRLAPHQSPLVAPLPGQTRGEFVFRDLQGWRPLVSAEQAVHLDESQNPYRGLNPYSAEDAKLFFGRGAATDQLQRHVRRHPLTVVTGPSGGGKSSLVHAGLLPLLASHPEESWVLPAPLRVTADPFVALYDALAAADGPPPPAAAELRGHPETVRTWGVAWMAAQPDRRLLVVVDQAEELLTQVIPGGIEATDALPEASAGFLACLAALLGKGGSRLQALVVVRSDYEPDLEEGPLAPFWSAGRFVVPPLTREELRQVIEGPAGCKALYFDDPRLVDRLVDEVVGMPGGLPLLSYALSRLYLAYLRSGRSDRLLTAADLTAIGGGSPPSPGGSVAPGGIVRILRVEADRAARELPDFPHRRTLWRVLLRMVNLVGARPTRRQVSLSELDYPRSGENDRVSEVLRRFIDKERLLVSDRAADLTPGGRGVVEPAHDELLVAWPQLARRIDAARELLPVHRRLTEAANAWDAGTGNARGERRRRRDLDLRLLGLVEASGLPEAGFNCQETDYVAAARAERRRRTVQRWTAVVVALLLTSGAALFFRYQSHVARSRELAALALATDQRDRGLLLAEAAYRVQPTLEARASLFSLLSILRHAEVFLLGLPPGVRSVAFSPDGKLIAAGGYRGKIAIWDLAQPGKPRWLFDAPPEAKGRENDIHALTFFGNGRKLLVAYERGGVRIWQLSSSKGRRVAGWPAPSPGTDEASTDWEGADPESPERRGERPVTALALDRTGGIAVAGDSSGRVFGIDLATSAVSWNVQLDLFNIDQVVLVPEDDIVVVADTFGHLRAVRLGSGTTLALSSQPHSSQLRLLRYLPEREQLLSLDSTGRLVRWQRNETGFAVEEQTALPLLATTAELDAARGRLLISSRASEIRSFSLETGEELTEEVMVGHRLTPLAIQCSETHSRCASGGVGGEVLVWNRERAHPLLEATWVVDQPVLGLRHGSGGELEVLTQTGDSFGWSLVGPSQALRERRVGGLSGSGAQENGDAVTLGFADGRVILLEKPDSRGETVLGLAEPKPGRVFRFAVASQFVAGVDQDHRLVIWRRAQPAAPFFESQLGQMATVLRFSPDERLLVVGHLGGELARWDLTQVPPRQQQGQQISTGPIFALAFSPDGRQLFTGSGGGDRHIRLWDPWSLQLVRELPERHTSSLSELMVSPDSKLLVSADDDGEVVLWDADIWREVGSLQHGIDTLFGAIALHHESTRLVTASDNGIWTWRISDKDLLEAACRIANRTIESTEWEQSVGGKRPSTGCSAPESIAKVVGVS